VEIAKPPEQKTNMLAVWFFGKNYFFNFKKHLGAGLFFKLLLKAVATDSLDMNYDHEYEDRYEDADQYEGEDGESDDEEEVAALGDAMELNQKLKQIMSSDLDPIAMQEQLNALMGGMNINMDTSQNHSQQRQQQQPRQQQRMVEGGKQSRKPLNNGMSHNNMRKAMKSTNSGKTFSNQEQVAQARNNQVRRQNGMSMSAESEPTIIYYY